MEADAPKQAYQYAIIADDELQTYTASGWEYVRIVEVPGTEMVNKEFHFEHAQPMQSGNYLPPPIHSSYHGHSGAVVRWSKVKVLVCRPRAHIGLEEELVKARTGWANSDLASREVERKLEEKTLNEKNLERTLVELREQYNAVCKNREAITAERDSFKKQFDTIELDIGKREMDRILGRFPAPAGTINLGDD